MKNELYDWIHLSEFFGYLNELKVDDEVKNSENNW